MAKIFISIGLLFIFLGVISYLFKDFSIFKLPGDIVIEKENFKLYFPITSSIIISIIFSIILAILSKILK